MKFLPIFVALTLIATPLMAAEKDKAETPVTKWIKAEKEMLSSMPDANKELFIVLKNKHSVIRTIEVVRDDVGHAVKECAAANPDLKADMTKRFDAWKGAVNPILDNAKEFMETELNEQTAFHVSDFQHVTSLSDLARNYSESKIEKTVVTTPEACANLLKSMDRTEDQLIGLLQDILLPENVIRQRIKKSAE